MIRHLIKKKMVDLPMKMLAPFSTKPPFTKQYGVLHRLNWSWKGHVSYVKRPMHSPTFYIFMEYHGTSYCSMKHYSDVIMGAMASQITSLTIVYSAVYSNADQRKHQSSASLAFVLGNSPVSGEFPAQKASNAENFSIWWRHHDRDCFLWNSDLS